MTKEQRAVNVYNCLKAHLDSNGLHYEPNDDELAIKITLHGDDLPVPLYMFVHADRQLVRILSPLPVHMPEDKRIDGAIATSIANYGIVTGNFDYDMSDGEIRYRVTQSFLEGEITDEMIKYMISIIFGTVDKYNDRFFMLGKGMMSLEQFIEAENK